MEALLPFAVLLALVICFAQGAHAQIKADEAAHAKANERVGTVLGKFRELKHKPESVALAAPSMEEVAVGLTLLELDLDPTDEKHWVKASQVLEKELQLLDELELVNRAPLEVDDLEQEMHAVLEPRGTLDVEDLEEAMAVMSESKPVLEI